MKKIRIAAILMSLFMLAGCETTVFNTIGNENEKQSTDISSKTNNSSTTLPTITPKPTAIPTPQPTPTPIQAQQPSPRTGTVEALKVDELDKLSNEKFSWWEVLNTEHKTPVFPPQAKLVSKYKGIYVGETSKKVLYLTFDEGYENGYTAKILDTLKQNNVKAIFFITGPYLKGQPELVKRMVDEGHQVGNHTVNHPSMPTLNYSSLEKEIIDLEKSFTAKYGKGMNYLRPPMGEYSERTLAAAQQLGYKTVMWSFHYLDYDVNNQKGADYAFNKVSSNLHNGAVLLLHAVSKDNTEALDRIIKDAIKQGYSFSQFDL
ncbi:MAG: pdaA [Clostridiales bacterium]|jgi:peptidoglycan-N-acetylmuramic acid deacetylase|nr:pdaA [Clostridiales bacterium]